MTMARLVSELRPVDVLSVVSLVISIIGVIDVRLYRRKMEKRNDSR